MTTKPPADLAELIHRAEAAGIPVYWIEPGRVSDPENPAGLGAPEYQFSDGPAGVRSTSADFAGLGGLAEGLLTLGPALYISAPDLISVYSEGAQP